MNDKPAVERVTLTVLEVAKALGINRNVAYDSVRRGEIPSIRVGRRLLVPKIAFDQLLASAKIVA